MAAPPVRCSRAVTSNASGPTSKGSSATRLPANFDTPLETPGLGGVVEVGAGESHTCAVLSGGSVDCWGRDDHGQVGNGTTSETQDTPVEVAGINATHVSAGANHTCALLSSGHVDCWGSDEDGQLGNGTSTREPQDTPVEVNGISSATEISAGDKHTCALMSSGHIFCWGDDAYGQLGDDSHEFPHLEEDTPVEVKGVGNATRVSAGRSFTCALLSSGPHRLLGAQRIRGGRKRQKRRRRKGRDRSQRDQQSDRGQCRRLAHLRGALEADRPTAGETTSPGSSGTVATAKR